MDNKHDHLPPEKEAMIDGMIGPVRFGMVILMALYAIGMYTLIAMIHHFDDYSILMLTGMAVIGIQFVTGFYTVFDILINPVNYIVDAVGDDEEE